MTYAEKIRSLTDEQLAEVLMCPQEMVNVYDWKCPASGCNQCILSFLKQNVGEEQKEDEE